MKRREFLQLSLLAGAGALVSGGGFNRLAAQVAGSGKKLVFVFCRGGADVMSMFPPTTLQSLTPYRAPELILSAKEYVGKNLGLPFYLHPGLSPLLPLFEAGQVALVPHTASMNTTRSHFVQQDLIESGSHLKIQPQGILGKTSLLLGPSQKGVVMGQLLPLSFRGADPIVINNVDDIKGALRSTNITSGLSRDQRLKLLKSAETCRDNDALCKKVEETRAEYRHLEESMPNPEAPTGATFIQQMNLAGQVISSPYSPSIVSVDMGGWDSHFGSLAKDSAMASNFRTLADGIMALRSKVSDADWNKTVVVVISEFGRTIRSNNDKGTDHGAGSMMLVLGGRVNSRYKSFDSGWDLSSFEDSSGVVPAGQAGSSAALLRKVDYRLVVSEVLLKQFGVSLADQQSSVFDGYTVGTHLGVLKG